MEPDRHAIQSGNKRGQVAKTAPELHSPWVEFMRFCANLRHGEISRLKIQDGLPVLAEVTTQKIRFRK